jgi:hypothetical protein
MRSARLRKNSFLVFARSKEAATRKPLMVNNMTTPGNIRAMCLALLITAEACVGRFRDKIIQ